MFNPNKMAKWIVGSLLAASSLAAGNLKPNGCDGPTLCPSFPVADRCSECNKVWHVDVGILYEQLGVPEMSPGRAYSPVYQNPTAAQTGATPPYGSYVDQTTIDLLANYDYSVGVTASLGHLLRHDNWYVGATFDWLSANLGKTYQDENFLYTYPATFALQTTVYSEIDFGGSYYWDKLNFTANADFYQLNVFLSRGSYHSCAFSYEPFVGVQALWFNNNYKVKLSGSSNTSVNGVFSVEKNQKNWGAGPMFGMNGEYSIAKGVSLFSDSSVGVLLGESDYTYTTLVPAENDVPENRFAKNKGNMTNVVYVPVRTILGIKLSTYCINDTQYLALKIGYDAQAVLSPTTRNRLDQGFQISTNNENTYTYVQLMNITNSITRTGLFVDLEWSF